jgi:Domain of unknown function (DUF4262)
VRGRPANLTEVARQRSVPLDHADHELLARIDGYGWAVMHIFQPNGAAPPYSFSVGLTYRFQQPEILMIGLPHDVMEDVINQIGRGMEAGQRFREGEVREDLLDGGYAIRLVSVHPAWYSEFVGVALWFHRWFHPERGPSFLQCVWTDQHHRFPWDPRALDSFRRLQPVLDRAPRADP